ncbi:hypothetical protein N7537_002841 [Penicillium hordei]|uniref:Uncharacterized protein n=1 Tax=Penicillium hordei TaxID=40994 RepID=A0AAD6EJQ9_9EURO|nr:uncharacterized protein N7537_002841 [Penicillium hordei]KAJ5617727.1 hypothetical protein N7537_002841 [Penicillium hordei]
MSPTGNQFPTNSSSPVQPHLSRFYKEASTSRWQLDGLFQTFLEDRPADTMLAVQERRLLISWDLQAIYYLRRCLRTWIQDKIPGDAIGAFLVTVLYEQDFHLDYLLTMMVRDEQTQLHIARRLLAFYQIRDEAGTPVWDNVAVYSEDTHQNPPALQRKSVAGSSAITRKELPHRIPTPPPADPRWPLFMSALSAPEIEDLMDKLDDDQYPDEDLAPLFTGVSEEDILIIQAFRRFNLHKNDFSKDLPLPESGADRIEDISKQTNTSQDKPLPSLPMILRKPLPTLPTDKAIPRKALPLPPLSRPSSPNPSSVRVSTFTSEKKKFRVRWADCVPSEHANIEQGKGKADLRSSAAARSKPSLNLNKPNAPGPSDTVYAYIHSPWHYNVPPPPPKLKKKAGVEDLRQARERGD